MNTAEHTKYSSTFYKHSIIEFRGAACCIAKTTINYIPYKKEIQMEQKYITDDLTHILFGSICCIRFALLHLENYYKYYK